MSNIVSYRDDRNNICIGLVISDLTGITANNKNLSITCDTLNFNTIFEYLQKENTKLTFISNTDKSVLYHILNSSLSDNTLSISGVYASSTNLFKITGQITSTGNISITGGITLNDLTDSASNSNKVLKVDSNGNIVASTISGDTITDSSLNAYSTNPLENKVITENFNSLNTSLSTIEGAVDELEPMQDTLLSNTYPNDVLELSDMTYAGAYYLNGNGDGYVKFSIGQYACYYIIAKRAGTVQPLLSGSGVRRMAIIKGATTIPEEQASAFNLECTSYVYYGSADDIPTTAISVDENDMIVLTQPRSGVSTIKTNVISHRRYLSNNVKEQISEQINFEVSSNYTSNIIDYSTGNFEAGMVKNDGSDSATGGTYDAYCCRLAGFQKIERKNARVQVDFNTSLLSCKVEFFSSASTSGYLTYKSLNDDMGFFAPENATHFRIYWQSLDGETYPNTSEITVYQRTPIGTILNKNTITWFAMGDSITQGWYSYINDGVASSTSNIAKGWISYASEILNFDLSNLAIGGTGYVRGNNSAKVAYATDFTDVELVTLMYGINDYKSSFDIGSMNDAVPTDSDVADMADGEGTLYANMRYTIEHILADNPVCKIIVITPLNMVAGTQIENWGIGYDFGGGNLESYYTAIKTVAEYYGIEIIDMTHASCVNRQNIESMLPDGVHPSIYAHSIIGRELAKKISFA